ncbi:hypothetical protein SNOG_05238 [Parastagonospora nodorum SN15]|uniref:Uncharacterized protein n=1 Tax=Phaeosphaeria nodorum (strain SN15 / ATCC MYA-4574 / FGSC 10173) TaxID=321614 RepID=Q0USM6_PHANO|nr:hypothetical protein SNOG_05238 [Parastagonospora nodorum SN15]EAT87629.1 hypothetical protein SNOG_05238 [Parastagonospora nodorum SN15]
MATQRDQSMKFREGQVSGSTVEGGDAKEESVGGHLAVALLENPASWTLPSSGKRHMVSKDSKRNQKCYSFGFEFVDRSRSRLYYFKCGARSEISFLAMFSTSSILRTRLDVTRQGLSYDDKKACSRRGGLRQTKAPESDSDQDVNYSPSDKRGYGTRRFP